MRRNNLLASEVFYLNKLRILALMNWMRSFGHGGDVPGGDVPGGDVPRGNVPRTKSS